MFQTYELFLIILGYMLVLFLVAYYAEKKEKEGASIVSNPYVYSLSLAVYCTSWTFYGSVGKAASSGLDFLTIYTGPTLMASLWWIVLRKIVRISKKHRITTISDFIGSRYGNSILLSALVTIIAVIGITPYLGLQIKAIINTFTICTGHPEGGRFTGILITFFLGLFAIIFGARRLDLSERHGGLVFAIAFESVIKLAAFLLVGAFVTFGLFNGFDDIFSRISGSDYRTLLTVGEESNVSHVKWFSLTLLSMMAIMFLPRQFHVSVVENSDENHIRKAMWLFPLYLLLMNIFVLPVAFGGLLLDISPSVADSYVLILPLSQDKSLLTIIAFMGGFSAATAMIIVESLALSTMVMNSLVIPALYGLSENRSFSFIIINIKRLVILASVFSGFLFATVFGDFYSLVDMGLKSFEAVSLFALPFLAGMYWRGGTRKGAIAGLIGGFTVWLYTLIFPALMRTGMLEASPALDAIFHSSILSPTALFGLHGLDKWSHSLFWSFSVNCLLYFGVSLMTRQNEEETRQAIAFVEMLSPERMPAGRIQSIKELRNLMYQYMGNEEGSRAFDRLLAHRRVDPSNVSDRQLLALQNDARKVLSGAIGSSIAALIMKDTIVLTSQEQRELSDSIKDMTNSLRLSRQELSEANRQLAGLKEFSERIIESLPLGISTIDENGRINYWNRYMEDLTGIRKNSANGADIRALMKDIQPCFLGSDIRTGEFLCERKTPPGLGSRGDQIIKVYVSPFRGYERGYVLAFEDITEKKRLERELSQASKHASLGRLTAGVSHEIGNPLASISSLVQELGSLRFDRGEDANFASNSYKVITGHLERIARIVRSLGDFARLGSPEKTYIDLGEVIERTIQLVKYDRKAKNTRILSDMSEGLKIKANPDQIQQVALNIMLNSMDAMAEGGELRISARRDDSHAEVTFSDNGAGMDPAIIDRIFDPFFTTKPLGKGTGLGLSICYGIINDHDGGIKVNSKEGEGTEFIIRLPLVVEGKIS